MKNIKNKLRKIFYGKIQNVGVVKGIGFVPKEDYYIDEDTYLFGFKLKSVRYWKQEDFINKIEPSNDRIVIKGFKMEKEIV